MTVCGCHLPPDGVATPSVVSSAAIAREDMPRTFMSASSGARLLASLQCCGLVQDRQVLGAMSPELHASCLGRPQRILRPSRDHPALLLRQCGVEVQHERVGIGAQLCGDERHPRGHQPGDEGDVAGQPIELGDDDGATSSLCSCQGCRELRPALQRIGALAGFDLDELVSDGETLALAELGDGTTLRFQAQAGASLPSGRHANVTDCRSSQLNAPGSVSRYFTDLRFRPLRHARFSERCKRPGQLGV